jgi:hypothetical protein
MTNSHPHAHALSYLVRLALVRIQVENRCEFCSAAGGCSVCGSQPTEPTKEERDQRRP